jgi:hypothetical protein
VAAVKDGAAAATLEVLATAIAENNLAVGIHDVSLENCHHGAWMRLKILHLKINRLRHQQIVLADQFDEFAARLMSDCRPVLSGAGALGL